MQCCEHLVQVYCVRMPCMDGVFHVRCGMCLYVLLWIYELIIKMIRMMKLMALT